MSNVTGKPTIVCVGDSITFGDTGLGFRAERPWPAQLEELLGAHVVNCGHNGAASADYRDMPEWRLAQDSMADADVLTIGLGVNDVGHDFATTPEQLPEVVDRVRALARDLTALASRPVTVCILSVPQLALEDPIMSRFGYDGLARMNPLLAQLDQLYREACPREGWRYIDYAPAILHRRDLHGDSIHPNQLGYDAIAATIATQLAKQCPVLADL